MLFSTHALALLPTANELFPEAELLNPMLIPGYGIDEDADLP